MDFRFFQFLQSRVSAPGWPLSITALRSSGLTLCCDWSALIAAAVVSCTSRACSLTDWTYCSAPPHAWSCCTAPCSLFACVDLSFSPESSSSSSQSGGDGLTTDDFSPLLCDTSSFVPRHVQNWLYCRWICLQLTRDVREGTMSYTSVSCYVVSCLRTLPQKESVCKSLTLLLMGNHCANCSTATTQKLIMALCRMRLSFHVVLESLM